MSDTLDVVSVHGEVIEISYGTVEVTISQEHGRTTRFALSKELFPQQIRVGSICSINISITRGRPKAPYTELGVTHNID